MNEIKCVFCDHTFNDVTVEGSVQCPRCKEFFNVVIPNTEFSVDVPGFGKVDVVRQDDGLDNDQREQFFWDLFGEDGSCLNEGNPFYTLPTKDEVISFLTTLDQEPDESMDGDHGSALASAGFGTDEDYEHHDCDSFGE